ncbi:MAG TPA: glycosyltransferase family 39 protein [Edaphobacter sp.]|nr:glycosyltransferase family 39 protein [Edaphobacter sp.]
MFRQNVRKHYGSAGAVLLLFVLLGELTFSIRQQSLSWDEGDHIFAGYMSWKKVDFGINPEHPPLVKALATIPLLPMHLKAPDPRANTDFKDEAYSDGRDFIFGNGGEAEADRMIFRARMAAASLSLLLGLLVFLAAREMFGNGAALFGLALVVFEPNMIAHGAYVTTDMGISCFIFASIYAFYRYVKAPSVSRLIVLGLVSGLALASKHSGVLLLPFGLALIITEILWSSPATRTNKGKLAMRLTAAFLAASAIAIVVLWAFYGFRYAARPGGMTMNPSLAEYAAGLKGTEQHLYLALARWHILPESYLYGLVDVRLISDAFSTYIFGKVYARGVWFYFPAAFIIKSTAAFMGLLLLAGFAIATGKLRARREIFFLTIPPLLYLLIATGTGLNIGARHILPMYPFLAVLIGGAALALAHRDRRWAYVVGLLLAWHAVSSARAYPNYLAYSNEFWGGPANTYKYLTDSNTDWGQQLKAVKKYLDNRGVKDCWFAYFVEPSIHFSAYGIPCKPLPTADTGWTDYRVDTPPTITGTLLISAGTLTGYELGSNVLNPYREFQKLKPVAFIQDGVFVYDGTFDMRFASALGHVTRARDLTAAGQLASALVEAQTAVALDPDELQAQIVLGDTFTALGRPLAAKPAYQAALAIAKTMEPSAEAIWVKTIRRKLAGR